MSHFTYKNRCRSDDPFCRKETVTTLGAIFYHVIVQPTQVYNSTETQNVGTIFHHLMIVIFLTPYFGEKLNKTFNSEFNVLSPVIVRNQVEYNCFILERISYYFNNIVYKINYTNVCVLNLVKHNDFKLFGFRLQHLKILIYFASGPSQ